MPPDFRFQGIRQDRRIYRRLPHRKRIFPGGGGHQGLIQYLVGELANSVINGGEDLHDITHLDRYRRQTHLVHMERPFSHPRLEQKGGNK